MQKKYNLTSEQLEFLYSCFTKNGISHKEITHKLINDGVCVISGKWNYFDNSSLCGFIQVEDAEEFIDCLRYKFDLSKFIQTKYYQELYEAYKIELENKIIDADLLLMDANNNLNSILNLEKTIKDGNK